MSKETKIIIAAFLITIVLIIGGAVVISRGSSSSSSSTSQNTTQELNIEANPSFYNLGDVPIGGGIVSKEYEVKNTTDKTLKLSRIATSCMCTTASIKIGEKGTKFFGMEMSGDKNPPVNLAMAAGQTGKVTVNFDPAAHGPQGVGAFDRIVWLYFNEGIKELKFSGTVVK